MKKILGGIFIGMLFVADVVVADCCPTSFCYDEATIPFMATNTQERYFSQDLDESVAKEIRKIKEKINESHDKLEGDSKTVLENIRKLNKEYYIVEQDILHNQILINELQNIVTDTIASSAEAQKSKNSLDILKQRVEK
jgi:septation ring formation regulator EzrA